jgi:hypothetical protein
MNGKKIEQSEDVGSAIKDRTGMQFGEYRLAVSNLQLGYPRRAHRLLATYRISSQLQ